MSPTDSRRAARERHTREAIQGFDNLPDSAGVRIAVVCALTGFSRASVWRHSRPGGLLPGPVKVSEKVTVWPVGALRRVLAGAQPAITQDSVQHARAALAARRAAAAA